ncbi:hypothetical protein [Roseisolibacter agri]|uniref:Uncharacterized protein n=1 Tax=Roseisolibacter agri TaxID=2014610 RepID=A0AA37V6J3_9BACT|nr:hypothetical protein [Roseisolibacter agri]GLC25406.1 hypothetical protein rosag_19190 [Roseisolibacter agri]
MLLSAVAYLSWASLRNRVRVQLRRARSPRTVVAVAAGATYVWWFLVRPANRGGAAAFLTDAWAPRLAALGLTLLAARWWLAGADPRALAFSPAEVHLLFPAPVTRRGLVAYKLLRAQLVILANTIIWTVILRGEGTHLASWRRALGLWILLSVLYLHRLGAALVTAAPPVDARAAHGWRRVVRRALPPALLAAAAVAVLVPVVAHRAPLGVAWNGGVATFGRALGGVLEATSATLVLAPARLLLTPTFAVDVGTWARALAPALALLALHFVWVLRTDAAVHEAALVASEERERRRADRRAGGTGVDRRPARDDDAADVPPPRRWTPPLAPVGPAALAIVWKNAVAALRATALARVLALYGVVAAGLLALSTRDPRLAEIVTVVVGVWLTMLLVAGPLWVRFDLRHDLAHLAVLRAWPLAGRDVVAAEVLASTLALTAAQLAILVLLFVASLGAPFALGFSLDERAAGLATAALGLPGVNAASLTVQNGAALLFPTWVRPTGGPRGVEAMGQNLLSTGLAIVFAAALLALPGAISALLAWGLWPMLGPWALAPAATLLTAAATLELRPVHAWLGRVFERTDPSAIGTAR